MRLLTLLVLALAAPALRAQEAPDYAPPAAAAPAAPTDKVVLKAGPHWWNDAAFDRHVSLVLNNADLSTATAALAKAANLSLIVSGGTQTKRKVILNLHDAPLRDVMMAFADLYKMEWFKTGEIYTLTYVASKDRGAYLPPMSRFKQPSLSSMNKDMNGGVSITHRRYRKPRTVVVVPPANPQ